jgi:hypothetical protein
MITVKPFEVKDYYAFKEDMEKTGVGRVFEVSDLTNMDYGIVGFAKNGNGTINVGAYNESLWAINNRDEDVDVSAIIQRHLTVNSVAIIHYVWAEDLDCGASVTVITPTKCSTKNLEKIGAEMLASLMVDGLPQHVKLLSTSDSIKEGG